MSRGHKDGRRRRDVCVWVGCWRRVQMSLGKKKKKKDKLLLVPLFLHPSDVPFLLVVWKTLTPRRHPPFLLSFPYLSAPICFTVPCTGTNGLAPLQPK